MKPNPFPHLVKGRYVINCRFDKKGRSKKEFWARVVYRNFYLNGEEIPKGHCIHHKNKNITDDRPENLELMVTGKHITLHHTGKNRSNTTKEKMRQRKKENPPSQEQIEKLVENNLKRKGIPRPPEVWENCRKAVKGKPKSKEHRENLSKAKKEYYKKKKEEKISTLNECTDKDLLPEAYKGKLDNRKEIEQKINTAKRGRREL